MLVEGRGELLTVAVGDDANMPEPEVLLLFVEDAELKRFIDRR